MTHFHRDIKPQNVLVTSKYTVVISDLGLGRHVDALPNSTTSTGTLGMHIASQLPWGWATQPKSGPVTCVDRT